MKVWIEKKLLMRIISISMVLMTWLAYYTLEIGFNFWWYTMESEVFLSAPPCYSGALTNATIQRNLVSSTWNQLETQLQRWRMPAILSAVSEVYLSRKALCLPSICCLILVNNTICRSSLRIHSPIQMNVTSLFSIIIWLMVGIIRAVLQAC